MLWTGARGRAYWRPWLSEALRELWSALAIMAEGGTLSEPDDSPKETAKPSALLQNLARIAMHASGAHRTYQNARYGSSSGAASAGKRLTVWTCGCGWSEWPRN